MSNNEDEAEDAAVVPPFECTFDEAIARFYGEWVLFQILEVDEAWEPVRGLVHAHSRDRAEISRVLSDLPPHSDLGPEAPHHPYYPFFARAVVHPDESDAEARARFYRHREAFLAERASASA
ncbi:MAG TPA: hypothetical protein VH482_09925 [Thermomicrobiales bacterium]